MKKTNKMAMVSSGYMNTVWRRVYIDDNGKEVVKYNGEIIQVEVNGKRLQIVTD